MTENLLRDVKRIIENHEEIIVKTGEGFNLISILGMENNERYTHSAIIAELLNPYGSHNFGVLFFEEFLKCISCDFPKDHIEVLTEEYVGLQLGSRTFLDIVIKDKKSKKVILIENKIWAEDQINQLERYQSSYRNSDLVLLYLTPFGSDYYNNFFLNYKKISYQVEIKKWIEKCIEIAKERGVFFMENSLKIYLNTIDKITNQSIYTKMADTIFYKILENGENLEAAEKISQQFNEVNNFLREEFLRKLREKVICKNFKSKFGKISITINEDNLDPIYLGIQLYEEYSTEKLILDNEDFNLVLRLLRNEFPQNDPRENNKWWNTWFYVGNKNSIIYQKIISSLDSKNKVKLYKDIDNQVEIIYQEFSKILNRLLDLIKS